MAVLHLNPEHGIGERLQYRTLYFYGIFFRHILTLFFCQYPGPIGHDRHRMFKMG
jgi:hypothetical protein